MSFEEDLAAPLERDWLNVDIQLNGKPYTLRFTAMNGLDWANECDRHPVRPGVTLDMTYGYDLRSLAVDVAPMCGVRVDGDPIDGDAVELPETDWAALFAKVDGSTFRRITDAIWALNEYLPNQAVSAAKKALAASGKLSTSRSSSVSPRGASSVGSRKKPRSTNTTQTDDSPAQ